MRAYVLIESAVGKANSVGEGVKKMSVPGAWGLGWSGVQLVEVQVVGPAWVNEYVPAKKA